LYYATINHHEVAVKALLAHPDIEVNKYNHGNVTALMVATRYDLFLIIELLLAHPDIDVNKADEGGITPLFWAVNNRNVKIIKLFLASKQCVLTEKLGSSSVPEIRQLICDYQQNPTSIRHALRTELEIDGNICHNSIAMPNAKQIK
jgi:ankyrin repeat protein